MTIKTLTAVCTITAALLFSLPSSQAASQEILASELAYHLGCNTWVSQLQLNGRQASAEICPISKGQVGSALISLPAYPTDREFTRLVIAASPARNGLNLSLQIAASPSQRSTIPLINLPVIIPLPPTLEKGDYVLGGVIEDSLLKNVRNGSNLKPADCREGLLLRIK
jgi:hypothetical protein